MELNFERGKKEKGCSCCGGTGKDENGDKCGCCGGTGYDS